MRLTSAAALESTATSFTSNHRGGKFSDRDHGAVSLLGVSGVVGVVGEDMLGGLSSMVVFINFFSVTEPIYCSS